jgi:hypothetical protein
MAAYVGCLCVFVFCGRYHHHFVVSSEVIVARFYAGLPAKVHFRQAERSFIRWNGLFNHFDLMGSVLFIRHFGFQVIDLFELRFEILEHVIGLTASGTRRTDKYDGFVCRKGIYFRLKLIYGNIDRGLEMTGSKFIGIPDIDQIDALRIVF